MLLTKTQAKQLRKKIRQNPREALEFLQDYRDEVLVPLFIQEEGFPADCGIAWTLPVRIPR